MIKNELELGNAHLIAQQKIAEQLVELNSSLKHLEHIYRVLDSIHQELRELRIEPKTSRWNLFR